MKGNIWLFYDLVHGLPLTRKYVFSQMVFQSVERMNDIRWPLIVHHSAVCHYKLTDIKARYGKLNVIKYGLNEGRFRYIHYMDEI